MIADVNGDTFPDIVTMDAGGTLDYFQGDGSGSFNPAIQTQPDDRLAAGDCLGGCQQ